MLQCQQFILACSVVADTVNEPMCYHGVLLQSRYVGLAIMLQ